MLTTILAYLLILLFSLFEGRLRKGQPAATFQAGQFDHQSTRRLGLAYALAILGLLAAPILNIFSIGHILSTLAGWIGLAFLLAGIGLRVWANRYLGAFYTRTLRVLEHQTVVQSGPYRFIRHPGYLGVILMWSGAGLAAGNWIVILLVLVCIGLAYHYRILTEEAMLLENLGEAYARYQAHTWRLLPYIY
ncbi:MAG: isoprenylcysteine carboxylmethyltransferase family protein [Anaerolineales bacterium]|jgi:protein-S-isoprenylcysteine O-methyltransferase